MGPFDNKGYAVEGLVSGRKGGSRLEARIIPQHSIL